MQAVYLLALDPVAEVTGDPNSYGFRSERSTADAMEQCFIVLARSYAAPWVLEGDIKACFDRIRHDWLLAHIPLETAMLRKWLTAGYLEKHILHPTDEGTPQGGPLSPVLANLALDGLEQRLREYFPKRHDARQAKVNLVRYADDFIITGTSRELLATEVRPLVETFLRERGLDLSAEKTTITHIEDGFDFLGHHVRKYGGKLLIKPSRKNVKAFLGKVRASVKAHKQAPAGTLIVRLNPVIRGWTTYHRHGASKETFQAVDHAIFEALQRWAKRRHSTKRADWVRKRYFRTHEGRQWVFFGEVTDATGEPHNVWLFSAARVPIERHTKIREAANPYDPAWASYFARRRGVRMEQRLQSRRAVLQLWKEQQGCCPVCREPITDQTGWHNRHRVWRSQGGTDAAANRVLLHRNCHRLVHSQGTSAGKPRPAGGE